jgi:hypothetical protein
MTDKRVYQFEPDDDEFTKQFGHHYQLSGLLFQGEGETMIVMLPNGDFDNIDLDALDDSGVISGKPNNERLAAIIKATDDPQYLDATQKVWLRKAQRIMSRNIQQKIWARDGFRCMFCNRKMGDVKLTIDHFVPLELGGEDKPDNYISTCSKCNKDKGSMTPANYCFLNGLDYDGLVNYLLNNMEAEHISHLQE